MALRAMPLCKFLTSQEQEVEGPRTPVEGQRPRVSTRRARGHSTRECVGRFGHINKMK